MPLPAQQAPLQPLVTNLWIGVQPTISPLHYDDYENLLCQTQGEKEVILFPPTDKEYLYYKGRPKGTLKFVWPYSFVREEVALDAMKGISSNPTSVFQSLYPRPCVPIPLSSPPPLISLCYSF